MNTSQIEQKTVQLLKASNALRAPVPLDLVFNHLGLVAHARALSDASGVLVVEGGKGVIGYNVAHSHVRQRFTMAHEVGHYVLHASGSERRLFIDKSVTVYRRDDASSAGNDRQEVEANRFAAALLMPKELVLREIERNDFDLDDEEDVAELAKRFNVSAAAMSIRLANIA